LHPQKFLRGSFYWCHACPHVTWVVAVQSRSPMVNLLIPNRDGKSSLDLAEASVPMLLC
jgi:hypothetical protein